MLVNSCYGGCGNAAVPLPPAPPPLAGGGGGAGLAPMDGRLYGMKNGAWVLVPQSRTIEYSYNNTVAQPPGGGQLRTNNANPQAATLLWVHGTSAPGTDSLNILKQIGASIGLYVQDKDDSSKWVAYNTTGPAVDKGTYVEIMVQFKSGSGVLPAGQRVMFTNTTEFV